MKQELEEALIKDFPELYKNDTNNGFYGFECDDGWEPLLRRLSEKLQAIILTKPIDERDQYKAAQIKEKFGGLRFYQVGYSDEMNDLINKASGESFITCEACGNPGTIRNSGWVHVYCDPCQASYLIAQRKSK